MGIRLANIFDKKAHQAIARQIDCRHGAPGFCDPVFKQPQDDKENDPFKKGLIQLGRVAPFIPRGQGEKHANGMGGHPAEKFSVDEVAQPAESIAEGNTGNDQVR